MATTRKPTAYNVHVRIIGEGKTKCPNCKHILLNEHAYSFGEYIRGKWRTVTHNCRYCYDADMLQQTKRFKAANNRPVNMVGYQGTQLEDWMKTD